MQAKVNLDNVEGHITRRGDIRICSSPLSILLKQMLVYHNNLLTFTNYKAPLGKSKFDYEDMTIHKLWLKQWLKEIDNDEI